MQLEMKELDALAEKLNLSKDEMLRESLKIFLERKLREIKTEIFYTEDKKYFWFKFKFSKCRIQIKK